MEQKSSLLWNPPQLHTSVTFEHGERKVGWLELFYDLVYVAMVIQLGNELSHDVTVMGFLQYVALFIPVWWAWTGTTFYLNRHLSDDVLERGLIFLQILFILILAGSIEGVFGELNSQFALAYVGIRVVLIVLHFRAQRHIPEAQAYNNHTIRGIGLAALIWLISAFVPSPINYVLWGVAVLIDLAAPFLAREFGVQGEPPPLHFEHLSERFSLLTIILLGESFIKIVGGAAGSEFPITDFIPSLFNLALVGALWWIYFDRIAELRSELDGYRIYAWVYTHFPLAVGLIAYGVASSKFILTPAGEPVHHEYLNLMGGSLIICLLSMTVIEWASAETPASGRTRAIEYGISTVLVILITIFGVGLSQFPLTVMLVVAVGWSIVYELLVRRPEPPTETVEH